MNSKKARKASLFWMASVLIGGSIACKAPQALAERWFRPSETTPLSTLVQGVATYPSSGMTEEFAAYPSLAESQEPVFTMPVSPYPEPGQGEESEEAPTVTWTAGVTENADASAYPIETPTSNLYPGVAATSTFPGPGNQYPAAATASSTHGMSTTAAWTQTPTLAVTSASLPPTAPSSTPTATRTPVPLPPWLSSELRATDPRSFRLDAGRVQLVMFFAFWSGVSQAMAPIVHGVESLYGERMNFVYLDIDDPATLPFQRVLDFQTPPHLFLLDAQGRVLKSWLGYVTAEELIAFIETVLE